VEEAPCFAGVEQVVAALGYWPSFHDADVLEMRLNRRPNAEGCYGPTLEALIHVIDFDTTGRMGVGGRYPLRHSVLIHLRFWDVVELQLEGFNYQNKLHELAITDIRGWQLERALWAVQFDSTLGVNASFHCYAVEVVGVVPCEGDVAAHLA